MPSVLEVAALVIGAVGVALPLWPRARRAVVWREAVVVVAAVWLTDLMAVRVLGLHAYAASCVLAPFGVCLPVTLVRGALIASALRLTAGHRGVARVATAACLTLVDATLLEALGVSVGLWRWAAPGALSLLAPFTWAGCAIGCCLVSTRWRAWAPAAALASSSSLVLVAWFALVRALPAVPERAALVPVLAVALIAVWLAAMPVAKGGGAHADACDVPDALRARHALAAGTSLLLAALVLRVAPLEPRAVPIDEALAADERSLVLVGDIMLGRNVARDLKKGDSFDRYFAGTRHLLERADVAFGNLESVVAASGTRKNQGVALRAPPEAAPALARAGFDVLSLANNHIADFGAEAVAEQLTLLGHNGLAPVGVGARDQPQEPVIVERAGHTFGFLAYCDPRAPKGCTYLDRELPISAYRATRAALKRDIPALRRRVDTVVVSLHWGVEGSPEPTIGQVELARRIIDLGADVVAGHHPHVPQRAERYRGGVIMYSMGNFVFDQHWTPAHMESGLYRIVVGKEGVRRAAVLPVAYQKGRWVPAPTRDTMLEIGSWSRLR
ncbi:MAG: CapA family protein [Deltaproteobacteria bacterium]|nr:CapA family protein [Deltaproteobacteria bacterium]